MKKIKKFLSMLLAILMIVSIIPVTSIEAEAAESWLWPVAGYTNWTTYAGHRGIDIPAPSGTPIRAAKSGTLYVYNNSCNGSHYGASPVCTVSGCNSNTGKCVYIIHGDGTASCYMHMVSLAVTSTKWVNQGEIIGYVGTTGPSTGNHLHFEAASGSGTNYWSYSLMNPGNLSYIYSTSIATTGISINSTSFSLKAGESKTLSATVSPSNATNKTVTWSSNNNGIATVSSSGVVKAVGTGACTITAKASGGQTASVVVVVNNETPVPVTYTTYNGHYYELYDSVLSWKDAQAYCEAMGGHLVTISNASENNIVQQLAKQGKREFVHIGATDENKEGTWEWITGERFSYINLGEGEPSAYEYDVEDYLRLSAITGKWSDIRSIPYSIESCGFVCEYDEQSIKPDAVTVIDNKVYALYDRYYPITLAEKFASDNNADLLTLNSEKEQNAVSSWIKANSSAEVVTLGGYADSNRKWHWTNGEAWKYENWKSGEPNNYNNNENRAVMILGDNLWNDCPDTYSYIFVLEYSIDEWIENGNSVDDLIFDKLPEGADPNDYELVTEYRSRDKQTTTSTASTMNGWTLYDSKTTYGSWGKVQSTSTKPTTSDTLQITGTWTQYHYYHHLNYYSGCYNIDSVAYGTHHGKHTIDRNSPLNAVSMADQGGKQAYGSQTCSCGFNFWFLSGTTTFYNYQTRSKSTTNYFYKWSDWSEWTEKPISSTTTKEVETRTVYRLKDTDDTTSNVTGLYKVDGTWYYFKNGKIDNSYTGLIKHTNGIWYYVEDGVVDWGYSGLWKHNGTWYYVEKGQINWNFNGLVKHTNGTWYYVQGAKLNWGYTGLVKHNTGSWFYVQKGQINFDYTGLVKHSNGIWYYIENGKLDWGHSGLWKHNGTWYYVQKGQINWKYNGLVKHTNGTWYYVQGAKLNWNYTGLVKHTNNKWYYVQKGQINFNYTGYVTHNGTRYKVVNGVKI